MTCPETTVDTTEAASVPGDGSGEQSLDGLYRWSILEDGAEVIITAFLENGEWGSSSTGEPHDAVGPGDNDGTHGTYLVDGDLVTFHIAEYDLDLTAQYTVDDDGTLHWTLPPPRINPGSDGVFFPAPWVRIGAAESVDATAGSGWTHILGDAARSGVADAGPTGEPVELWRFHAEDACDGAPIVVGQTAFVACRDSNLYALSVSDGSESWRFHAAAPFGGGLAAADGLVYAADEAGTLYAVDMVAGTEVWRLDAGVTTAPATEGGLLAVGTGDGALVGFDAATGVERWRYVVADAVELRSPAIANGLVYAGSEAAGLTAVDASTGELVWQSDSGGPTGSVRVIDGTAYVGCRDGNATPLSAFDADTGDLRWRREGGCVFPPAVVDGVAYSGGEPGDVNAFDTGDGSELWHVATGSEVSQAPVVAGDVVYVITNGVDAAFAYDAATGEELWRYDLSASHAAPAVAGGRLYTTDSGGDVVAIGGSDQFPDADPVSESTAAAATASIPENAESLPEGLYRTGELTRDELIATGVAAGFDAEEVEALLNGVGVVGYVELSLRLEDGGWTIDVAFDGVPQPPAPQGTYELVDADTVIATGDCGQPITLRYALDGDSVTFEVIDDQCAGFGESHLIDAVSFESAPFTLAEPDTTMPSGGFAEGTEVVEGTAVAEATEAAEASSLEGRWSTGPVPIGQIRETLLEAGVTAELVDDWVSEVGSPSEFTFDLEFHDEIASSTT